MPPGAAGGHGAGGADEDSGVNVVAAGVHDAGVEAGGGFGDDVGGVGQAGFFDDGQGIHVGADEEGRAGAVFEEGDDTEGVGAVGVDADVVGDGVAGVAEGGGEDGGGALLVMGELGVGVKVFVEGDEVLRRKGGLGEADGRSNGAQGRGEAGEGGAEQAGAGHGCVLECGCGITLAWWLPKWDCAGDAATMVAYAGRGDLARLLGTTMLSWCCRRLCSGCQIGGQHR